jgi:1-acyl-sn-glycerol-3-phosphate acyltransferase
MPCGCWPAILLVKHQSTWETFTMPTIMPHPLAYVFKKELLYVPFFGWAMGRLDMIHIDRSQRAAGLQQGGRAGQAAAGQGVWVIMFPEGTRIPRGEKGAYKSGGTRLAIETGAPVIPIAVTSAKCWPRKAFVKPAGRRRHLDRPRGHRQRGPQARRADARGGGLDRSRDASHAGWTPRPTAGVPQLTLHLALPHHASPAQIRDAVQAWLMRQAKRVFLERLEHFAPRLGVQWRKLSLSSAGTRWGSASADGSIRLNWRLIHFRLPVIDYVVAHELSHLRVMDHSARFWDTVRTVVPDYAELRNQLKAEVLPGL